MKNMRQSILFALILALSIPGISFAQLSCLYVDANEGNDVLSVPLYEKMMEWGYNITYISSSDLPIVETVESVQAYDFMFIDEIVGSGSLEAGQFIYEGHTIPLFTTENYAPRANILGYTTNTQATNIPAEPVSIVDGDHPMAAGFSTGAQVIINSGAGNNEDLIPNLPDIDFIPIAESTTMSGLYIAYGVDAGGQTVNGVDIVNRGAVLGFHANGYAAITDDGFLMMKAMLDWITEGIGTSVEEDERTSPENYVLAQNYPNPFNPDTRIEFQLKKSEHTTLNVYNSLGQLVQTLVDTELPAGNHSYTFRPQEQSSGVYYYSLKSGIFKTVRKMAFTK